MKQIRYFIEAFALILFYGLCDLLPASTASDLGGAIGRKIGPRLAASRKARKNMKESFPLFPDQEIEDQTAMMWDNLGRLIAEYPHLRTLAKRHTTIEGLEIIKAAQESGRPFIVFGAHLGNWEVMAPSLLEHAGIKLGLVYRAPNNPVSDRLLDYARSLHGAIETIPKSRTGTRRLVQTLKEGHSIGILIDQKYNEGIAVPFFGRPAMTSPAFVQLAQKYDATLIPFYCIRESGNRFKLAFEEPLDTRGSEIEVIERAHARLESWISTYPGQWMWLHRRWGKEENKND
ncbi:MAG: lysophospholipid acyltransferase family protein [Micavibrio sp.]